MNFFRQLKDKIDLHDKNLLLNESTRNIAPKLIQNLKSAENAADFNKACQEIAELIYWYIQNGYFEEAKFFVESNFSRFEVVNHYSERIDEAINNYFEHPETLTYTTIVGLLESITTFIKIAQLRDQSELMQEYKAVHAISMNLLDLSNSKIDLISPAYDSLDSNAMRLIKTAYIFLVNNLNLELNDLTQLLYIPNGYKQPIAELLKHMGKVDSVSEKDYKRIYFALLTIYLFPESRKLETILNIALGSTGLSYHDFTSLKSDEQINLGTLFGGLFVGKRIEVLKGTIMTRIIEDDKALSQKRVVDINRTKEVGKEEIDHEEDYYNEIGTSLENLNKIYNILIKIQGILQLIKPL